MLIDNSDKSWETLGRTDPYYGVLTDQRFRRANLGPDARREFFASGATHMTDLLHRVEEQLGSITRGRALDFGCGVGRLALPLAREAGFATVVGMDISESMLSEARSNASKAQQSNIEFAKSDDTLSQLTGAFDFVHSFIVLQHIPVSRGETIVRHLLQRLAPGGVAALQMPFARQVGSVSNFAYAMRLRLRPLHIVANLLRGRPWNEPPMQMNRYDMNSLLAIFQSGGLRRVTAEFLDDGGNIGAYLFARKDR